MRSTWLADVTLVQRDGDDMAATYAVAESSSDGTPADRDPPFLTFTFEDGVTADDLGITRVSNGWVDTGDITFRVTDLDSEPPTAVLRTEERNDLFLTVDPHTFQYHSVELR